jgi:iron complex outermembrane receptor protein
VFTVAGGVRRPAIAFPDNTMATIRSFHLPRTPIAAAALLLAAGAHAQTTLAPVTVTGRAEPVATVTGWGDIPLSQTPLQASVISAEQLRDRGAQRLADLVKVDASLSDAYNADGYWDFITVRGFTLDNRFNYRRDGLPISAETSIPLDNKERVEVLKGASGIQAGTSAPGGLVNLVVKRPTDEPLRSVQLGWREPGSVLGAVDIGQRFGAQNAFGVRLNVAYEHLDPQLYSAKGKRHLLAAAGDWRLSASTLIETEFETSHRSQPSQPGFSLLGSKVPAPVDPRINLNNQAWSQPVVMDANTASLRVTQRLSSNWRATAHGMTQQLRSDDRLAYAYGCSAEINYSRYCSDGTFDFYDFRSENERRRTDALELALQGEVDAAGLHHTATTGVLQSRVKNRFQRQAYNYVGTGLVDGNAVTPADPSLTDENTNRNERSTEFFARDALRLNESLTAWLGLRHTQLYRESVRTDGSRATAYKQSFTTPSIAASYTLAPEQMLYASWGRGVESEVVDNRARFINAGEGLSSTSRQIELGLKVGTPHATWGLAWFDIVRPVWGNTGANCNDDTTPGSCTRVEDGTARHRGVEANAAWRDGAWAFQGGLQVLQARRNDSIATPEADGKRPTNVPARTLKLQTRYQVAEMPGLSLQADALGVSNRMVLADNSVGIAGYGVADLSARYQHKLAGNTTLWRAGVDNIFNRRAWRESPFQFGHVYLYPLAARTFRLSVEMSL